MVRPLRPEPDARTIVAPETALLRLFLWDFQPFAPPDPFHAPMVHVPARLVQEPRHHPVAVPRVGSGQLDDVLGETLLVRPALRDIALGRTMLPENKAGPAFRDVQSLPRMVNAPAAARRAQ